MGAETGRTWDQYTMKFIPTILSAAAMLCLAEAEVFDVDWIYGMEDADTAICVPPGSQINFVWETNHNVVLMENKEDFDACTNISDTEPYEGPLLWDAPSEEGVTYIVCGVRTHCADGNQKLAVTVSMDC